MKAIFNQMETEVEQCSIDKRYFEIDKKELLIEKEPVSKCCMTVPRVLPAVASIPADTTGTPSSTSLDQDTPSASTSPTTHETQSPIIHPCVEEQETENAEFDNDPF
ncbi:hypothetical protein Tco_1432770 [Tanacetum coccineum]